MKLAPGATFDRYVVESIIGEGGMGCVYCAFDPKLNRRVALKLISAAKDDEGDGVARARLLREARAAAALDHPGVVSIFDVGEVEGTAYIAMELVDGRSLRTLVGDASAAIEQRIEWLRDLARALAAAHSRGLVHRDVKPDNVMVRTGGGIKVLDFGIARSAPASIDPAGPAHTQQPLAELTQGGIVMGTLPYMAPEQIVGAAIDGRADQFAWGVVAYELLSGQVPWRREAGERALLTDVLSTEAPPLDRIAPGVGAVTAAVVARALAKDARDRFASMDDLIAALGGVPASGAAVRVPAVVADGNVPLALAPTKAARMRSVAPPRGGSIAWIVATASVAAAAIAIWLARAEMPVAAESSRPATSSAPVLLDDPRPRSRAPQPALAAALVPANEAGAAAPSSSGAAVSIAASCADHRDRSGVTADGAYRIDPDGAGPLRAFDVYCHGMGDPARAPREFLSLDPGADNTVTYVWEGGACACPNLTRTFSRVRLTLAPLAIDSSDGTFAAYSRALDCEARDPNHCGSRVDLPYGGAGSCRARGDTSGHAHVDLRGTAFVLAPRAAFVASGYASAGSVVFAGDRKSATLSGGGLCGSMVPAEGTRIPLVQDPAQAR